MERRDYFILIGLAVLVIIVGAFTTTKPLEQFFMSGASEAANTAIVMVWITWWALVLGFAIAGGVEAWVSNETIAENLDGYGARALGLGTFFGSSPLRVAIRRSPPQRISSKTGQAPGRASVRSCFPRRIS